MNDYGFDRYDDRYLITLREYALHNPTSSKQMVSWCPAGYYDIEVTLDDGSRWTYNYATSGMRCVSRDVNYKLYENEEEYKRTAGCVLQKRIKDAGLTQTDFARECGLSYTTLRNYIRGTNLPNTLVLKRMAAVLGCSPTALMDFE